MKLGTRQHQLLCEALRRFECFAIPRGNSKWCIKDLTTYWTGLGPKTEYQPAINGKYMTPATKLNKGGNVWWSLTEKGARIVLNWHNQGFCCENNELKNIPSLEV